MSREKSDIPVIRETRMRERGWPTFVVICPKCEHKFEQLLSQQTATNCPGCRIGCVPFTTYDMTRRIAEIDMMPLSIFIAYLKKLGKELIKRNQIHTAQFLAEIIYRFNELMEIDFDIEGWHVVELEKIFQ